MKSYDNQLLSLKHFSNLPEKLTHIGKHWDKQIERILFVAESHYVDITDFEFQTKSEKLQIDNPDLFYQIQSNELTEAFRNYFNTRKVISDITKGENLKGKDIYLNLKKVLAEYAGMAVSEPVFDYFSIYNYFQRPSYGNAITIKNTIEDNKIAFNTISKITEVLKPTIIFFISVKAYNTFMQSKDSDDPIFNNIKIYRAPHPARAWWNKTSAEYGNKTGKGFVKMILSTKRNIIK
jgi:hypothetical protein